MKLKLVSWSKYTVMLGGRAAEEIVINEMTSGASNDISKLQKLPKAMVTEWGMSDLGLLIWEMIVVWEILAKPSGMSRQRNSQAFMEKIDN